MPKECLSNLNLMSIKDLSKLFNLSQTTVYRIVESRKIPFYKISGVLRFSETDVIKYLEENRVEQMRGRK